jgi:asparagine synthase (glutamine-hydrolysing)
MKLAQSKGVPVVLQGQGGDELFWGYPWVKDSALLSEKRGTGNSGGLKALSRYWSLHALPKDLSRSSVGHWIRTWGGIKTGLRLLKTHGISPGDHVFFYELTPDFYYAFQNMPNFYTTSFAQHLESCCSKPLFPSRNGSVPADVTITRLICDTYLRENGVAQADRLSMACSIELRLPLIDYRLVEKVVGLRKARSDLDLPAKSWLKDAVKDVLPKWVLDLPKRGFTPPVREWHSAIFKAHGDNLKDGYLVQAGILTSESALQMSRGLFPRGSVAPISFKAIVLELWCRRMSMLCNNSRDR